MAAFSIATPRFLTHATFNSVAFQLPELGLLTLAMVMPIVSGGINLSVTFTANICGLTLASVLHASGGLDAGPSAFLLGSALALGVGFMSGLAMGLIIAFTGAHPILVSLSMMIFLRGLGEYLTRGGDISGFPDFIAPLGHGMHSWNPRTAHRHAGRLRALVPLAVALASGLRDLYDWLEHRGDTILWA